MILPLTVANNVTVIYNKRNQSLIQFQELKANGKPISCIENFKQILSFYNVTIRFNEMIKDIEIIIDNKIYAIDLGEIKLTWFCNYWEYPTKELDKLIIDVSRENAYHPVREWIESKPWDGTSRLQTVYDTVLSSHPMRDNLIRKWMISAVAAIYEPIFSSEGALIFIGQQGIGKTTWLWSLVPPNSGFMKTGSSIDPHNKDSLLKSLSHWIVELGEITQTMNKNDINTLKAFLTDGVDIIRAPYARIASKHKRMTVFCGSTNEDRFLAEGENRRFWTIPVDGLTQLYNTDVQQVWAEILELYRKSNKTIGKQEWFLNKQERDQLYVTQDDHAFINPIHELLESRLLPVKGMDYETLNATAILIRCGIHQPNRQQLVQATNWLKANKYQMHRGHTYQVNINHY